jgi:hypothetical protein
MTLPRLAWSPGGLGLPDERRATAPKRGGVRGAKPRSCGDRASDRRGMGRGGRRPFAGNTRSRRPDRCRRSRGRHHGWGKCPTRARAGGCRARPGRSGGERSRSLRRRPQWALRRRTAQRGARGRVRAVGGGTRSRRFHVSVHGGRVSARSGRSRDGDSGHGWLCATRDARPWFVGRGLVRSPRPGQRSGARAERARHPRRAAYRGRRHRADRRGKAPGRRPKRLPIPVRSRNPSRSSPSRAPGAQRTNCRSPRSPSDGCLDEPLTSRPRGGGMSARLAATCQIDVGPPAGSRPRPVPRSHREGVGSPRRTPLRVRAWKRKGNRGRHVPARGLAAAWGRARLSLDSA